MIAARPAIDFAYCLRCRGLMLPDLDGLACMTCGCCVYVAAETPQDRLKATVARDMALRDAPPPMRPEPRPRQAFDMMRQAL